MKAFYYHVSREMLSIGTRLYSGGSPMIKDQVSMKLEEARPPVGHWPRHKSIYMVAEPIFTRLGVTYDEGFVHIIAAANVYGPYDIFWIGVLQYRLDDSLSARVRNGLRHRYNKFDDLSVAQLALNYWSGIPSDDCRWEYATDAAEVLACSEDPISLKGDPNPIRL